MKFTYRINGVIAGDNKDQDSAINLARRAAIANNESISNIEIVISDPSILKYYTKLKPNETLGPEDEFIVVHRDLVLKEDLAELKSRSTKDQVGVIVFTKAETKVKKEKDDRKLYQVDDYIMLSDELFKITEVTDTRATATPVRKKSVQIKDKFTDKTRTFETRRRPITISPYATEVLSAAEVKKALKDIENKKSEQANESVKSDPDTSSGISSNDRTASGSIPHDSGTSTESGKKPRIRRKRT